MSTTEKSYKKEQMWKRGLGRNAWKPKDGFQINPLLKLLRNLSCPCQSGKKFKACHLDLLEKVISDDRAKVYEEALKQPLHTIRFNEIKLEDNSAMAQAAKEEFKDVAKDTKALMDETSHNANS